MDIELKWRKAKFTLSENCNVQVNLLERIGANKVGVFSLYLNRERQVNRVKFKAMTPFRFLMIGVLTLQIAVLPCIAGFQTTAFAADLNTTEQETTVANTNTQALIGLLAVGLLAMRGHGSHSDTVTEGTTQTNSGSVQTNPSSNIVTNPSPVIPSSSSNEKNALNLLNKDRAANGLPPLKLNNSLVSLAENYADDMISRNYFSHYNPEGQSPFDRMKNAGIRYSYAGENIAINSSVDAAEKAFMNSPGHRANILSSNYTEVGIGVKLSPRGSVYVVQEFISR